LKIITEPRVTVVAHTVFVGHPEYLIPPDGDQAVRTCAFAAKGCYDSYGESGRSNVVNQETIISTGHGSVLEHFSISLFIEGITRGLSLEMNRHRHFAISQRSTRYTAEEDAAIVLEPYFAHLYHRMGEEDFHGRERDALELHLQSCDAGVLDYRAHVEQLIALNPERLSGTDLRKWARGKARNILPHALETRGTWTGNLRAWRHFLEMRSERFAEAEIRRLATHVFNALQPVAPLYFADYKTVLVGDWPEFQTDHRKV
jgi:thymidylate synthase (FAD)